MATTRNDLSGEDIVLLIEALDALIPFREDTAYSATAEERERWAPYSMLRYRLKVAVEMSFYDTARGWLEAELQRERTALTDKLHSRLAELLMQPGANRRSVRQGFVIAVRELRETQQSPPRPLSERSASPT